MSRFVVAAGVRFDDDWETDVERPRPSPQRIANLEFFLTHDAPAVRRYRVDVAALRSARTTIVPAAGRTSQEAWPHRCAVALAQLLGIDVVEFPGAHSGFVSHPKAFAARLREVFDERAGRSRK